MEDNRTHPRSPIGVGAYEAALFLCAPAVGGDLNQ